MEENALVALLAEMPECNEVYVEFLQDICYQGMQQLLESTTATDRFIPVGLATPAMPASVTALSSVDAKPRVLLPARLQHELEAVRRDVFLKLKSMHERFGVTVYGYIDGSKYSSPSCPCVCGSCLHCLHRRFHD